MICGSQPQPSVQHRPVFNSRKTGIGFSENNMYPVSDCSRRLKSRGSQGHYCFSKVHHDQWNWSYVSFGTDSFPDLLRSCFVRRMPLQPGHIMTCCTFLLPLNGCTVNQPDPFIERSSHGAAQLIYQLSFFSDVNRSSSLFWRMMKFSKSLAQDS